MARSATAAAVPDCAPEPATRERQHNLSANSDCRLANAAPASGAFIGNVQVSVSADGLDNPVIQCHVTDQTGSVDLTHAVDYHDPIALGPGQWSVVCQVLWLLYFCLHVLTPMTYVHVLNRDDRGPNRDGIGPTWNVPGC
eukprot:3763180-Rhodomonas_salina.2